MPDLLWEIGCEELPATFVAPTLAQLQAHFREKFGAVKLWSESETGATLKTYGTPRRLVVHATGVAARQSDETVVIKGPAQNIAFDADGNPTRAALGFAQKNGIAPEDLAVVDGYVQASVTRLGRPAIEIAAELLPKIARELTFPKAMRWGVGKMRFARPIRWIVALLDNEVIPFSIEHVTTGRTSRGHRFLAPDEFDVPTISNYFNRVREHWVLIDPAERREMIVAEARRLALTVGGNAVIDEDLLEENTFLTEYPTAVLGSFDQAYMALPKPILVTAMRKHQRYFPIIVADKNAGQREIAAILADKLGIQFVDLSKMRIQPEATASIPPLLIRYYNIFPFRREENKLMVAVVDKKAASTIVDDLEQASGCKITLVMASKGDIEEAIIREYGNSPLNFGAQAATPEKRDADELLPKFIAIRNGGMEYLDIVRAGYEHVLSARFNDAKFFLDLDLETPLSDKIEGTKKIVFQEKLGSVYQKSLRIASILSHSGLTINLSDSESHDLLRAAELCKADLASEMVKELPALQGVVGSDYALRDGESQTVAQAIVEHYMPKGAGDPLPSGIAGLRLAIADRVDTLVGYLGIGIVPSGSSDPFALRRAASGLVALLATSAENPPLKFLFDAAWAAYGAQEIALSETKDSAFSNWNALLSQRLDASLDEKCVRYDLRDAALASSYATIFEIESRALALQDRADSDDFRNAAAAATRIGNIVRFAQKEKIAIPSGKPRADLFEHAAETELWQAWLNTELAYNSAIAVRDWTGALHGLANLRIPADNFFDSVMVISDDIPRRDNRLALLARLREAYDQFADFDRVVMG